MLTFRCCRYCFCYCLCVLPACVRVQTSGRQVPSAANAPAAPAVLVALRASVAVAGGVPAHAQQFGSSTCDCSSALQLGYIGSNHMLSSTLSRCW